MFHFFWIALITVSLLVGLNFYISSQTGDVAEFTEELKNDTKKRKELFNAMSQSVEAGRSIASSEPIIPSFQDLKYLKHINANDPLQVLLGNILVSRSIQARAPLNEEMKAKLKENPAESFKSMKSFFDTLPSNEFPVQKAALLALAIEVNAGKAGEVQELALNHLLTEIPTAQATEVDALPTVDLDKVNLSNIAYEAYLINTNDPETALNETFKILELQENNLVRENIIDNFKQTYPAQGKLLEKMVTESKMSDLAHDRQDVEAVEVVEEVKEVEEGMDN
ncbi:MAG TPA: hypothetical protein VNJ08_00595 [Bacteriovoracaceae bacterium]|nr:hypothetical protein [Bacteriovoracaceae bacterium]